jgi:hypothetical protein
LVVGGSLFGDTVTLGWPKDRLANVNSVMERREKFLKTEVTARFMLASLGSSRLRARGRRAYHDGDTCAYQTLRKIVGS